MNSVLLRNGLGLFREIFSVRLYNSSIKVSIILYFIFAKSKELLTFPFDVLQ